MPGRSDVTVLDRRNDLRRDAECLRNGDVWLSLGKPPPDGVGILLRQLALPVRARDWTIELANDSEEPILDVLSACTGVGVERRIRTNRS